MKRRICALICAVLLCVCILPARALTEGDVYFTSVNDALLPLAEDSMPVWVNGVLYVPAAVFDRSATGSSLGLYFNQNLNVGVVTLYTLSRMLIFDLKQGTVYDQRSGQYLSPRAVTHNGQVYLPVEMVCDFFELEDSYTYTRWGYLVRIKDSGANLTDARFIDAASSIMSSWLEELMAAQKPPEPPVDDPPPVIDDPPEPVIVPAEPENRTQVCLAFRCEGGGALEQILDGLEQRGWTALFLFAPETLAAQDDLVRRTVGSGHSVGLIGQGDELAAVRARLNAANGLLAHIARTAATIALVPSAQRDALGSEGWVCWRETMDLTARTEESGAALARQVTRELGIEERTVYLTLDDSDRTAQLLEALMERLEEEKYTVLAPLESRL